MIVIYSKLDNKVYFIRETDGESCINLRIYGATVEVVELTGIDAKLFKMADKMIAHFGLDRQKVITLIKVVRDTYLTATGEVPGLRQTKEAVELTYIVHGMPYSPPV